MKYLSRCLLRLFGWEFSGEFPGYERCVIIVAPHTSNWDFVLGILTKSSAGLRLNYLGKHSLFKWYCGWFFKALGGIPVNRGGRDNVVAGIVDEFARRKHMILALAPEGTRSYHRTWKSGFYQIVIAAQVPLVLAYIDAGTHRVGFCGTIDISGDVRSDMDAIRCFYADITGIVPELANDIRLTDEQVTREGSGTKSSSGGTDIENT